jgi:hypothetical protein
MLKVALPAAALITLPVKTAVALFRATCGDGNSRHRQAYAGLLVVTKIVNNKETASSKTIACLSIRFTKRLVFLPISIIDN